ncbi:hypothetical protein GGX14DRAFT_358335 [Mycena pura]|uniref:Uncharacterized protein n=1 Tax=Mycena pura TaxID=153505 RepID=A0AAD6VQK6_9AGAR|nr:hypothetical protein GGX14DRAFT_358335 [Mycena pura]
MEINPGLSYRSLTPSPSRSTSPPNPAHSRLYIEIEHHPHSGLKNEIIPLDSDSKAAAPQRSTGTIVPRSRHPWAPFPSRPDFEWAETMYLQPQDIIKSQLKGLHGSWNPNGTALTIQTEPQLRDLLAKARQYGVEFESDQLTEEIDAEERAFTIRFRDPWQWVLEVVTDASLADDIVWYPYRKYLVVDGAHQRLRDEAYTADLWWDMQSKLPHIPGMHHCMFPLLLWLDEGRVTSHTNMYPMLLRSLSLPSAIRNGSGNGGSFLVGFMAQIKDHRDPKTRSTAEKVDFAYRKRKIYHRVHRRVLVKSLGKRSRDGEAVVCGDKTARVLYPAIPIISADGKEADAVTATRAALAHFPCSRCLVRTDQLRDICIDGIHFDPRTTDFMRRIFEESQSMQSKRDRESHLQNHGLHAVENAFWEIENSDPYKSVSYDLLHSDDLGKFGKKIWPAIQKVLEGLKTNGLLTKYMGDVPRWPGLKHFENVTTKEMNNGQEFFDIEKSLLPCVVQLLPKKSPWVHIIRAHARYRMMLGLHCISDQQIARKEKYQAEYEKWSKQIAKRYSEYQFNFPKQHDPYHSSDDVRDKGAPSVYCTRVNEGHHQENRDSATRGNHRDNDKQVSEIDATKEAMARIRMIVDAYDKELSEELDGVAGHAGVTSAAVREAIEDLSASDDHWRYGGLGRLEDSRSAFRNVPWLPVDLRRDFDRKLRAFLRDTFNDETFRADGEEPLLIRRSSCIYIHYTSAEDYTDKIDLLRCNPHFQTHGDARFDCINVNIKDDALDFARMLCLFRCRFPSKREEDIALVRLFRPSTWKPNTVWENCRVLEDGKTVFMLPKYFIRGAHLINAFGSRKPDATFYLNDVVDSDWFLRAGN